MSLKLIVIIQPEQPMALKRIVLAQIFPLAEANGNFAKKLPKK